MKSWVDKPVMRNYLILFLAALEAAIAQVSMPATDQEDRWT